MSEPTTTSPASMGGPLSEADRIAEIRRTLKMAKLASANAPGTFWHTFTENTEFLLGKVESLLAHNGVLVTEVRFQAERADSFRSERDAATARVGVLEGQLATAREELAARPKPRPRATVKVSLTKCTWCLEDRREMSEWEQKNLRGFWKRLCKPCARKRLNNGYNALLGMRKVDGGDSDA